MKTLPVQERVYGAHDPVSRPITSQWRGSYIGAEFVVTQAVKGKSDGHPAYLDMGFRSDGADLFGGYFGSIGRRAHHSVR